MEDTEKDKNNQPKKKITSSLAFRVFLVCFFLLVIPLLFHGFFMYKEEYNQKVKDVLFDLNILAKGRKHLFNDIVNDRKNILNDAEKYFLNKKDPNKYLESFVGNKANHILSMFYIEKKEDGRLVCSYSSNSHLLGVGFTFLESMFNDEKYFSFAGGEFPVNRDCLWVGKCFYEKNKLKSVLVTTTAFVHIMDNFVNKDKINYPMDIYLLSDVGNIFASTVSNVIDQNVKYFVSQSKTKNDLILFPKDKGRQEYEYIFRKDKGLAIKVNLTTNLDALLTISNVRIASIQKKQYFYRLFSFIGFFIVIGGSSAILLIIFMSRPLKNLCDIMQRVSVGDLNARYFDSKFGFDINVLGQNFNSTIDSLVHHQQEAEKQKLHRQQLEQEFQIGYDIQKNILPKQIPSFPKLDIFPGFVAAKEVSGDYYDLFIKDENTLAISIADTSGKGISACLYSFNIRSILRSFLSQNISLSEAIIKSNKLFLLDTKDSSFFVTSWIGFYDKTSRELSYTSCGHYPAILKRKSGEIEELTTEGMALGVQELREVVTKSIKLGSGDMIILFTDGIIDTRDVKGELFGKARLIEFVKSISIEEKSSQVMQHLLKKIDDFSKEAKQEDDIAALVIKLI